MCFQFCTVPNLEKLRSILPTRVPTQIFMQLWVKNKSLTFPMINSIFHRGGEVCAWEQTKFDLIIEFQLLTKFSIHSSTASWLNWIIDLRRGRGERAGAHNTFKATKHLRLQIISNCFQLSLYQFILIHVHYGPMIFKFIIQSWFPSCFQFVLSSCFYFSCEYIFPSWRISPTQQGQGSDGGSICSRWVIWQFPAVPP